MRISLHSYKHSMLRVLNKSMECRIGLLLSEQQTHLGEKVSSSASVRRLVGFPQVELSPRSHPLPFFQRKRTGDPPRQICRISFSRGSEAHFE